MPTSATKPSTRRLSEVARHVVIPTGVETTGWPAVEAKAREFGDTFDEWQNGAGRLILGKRADGMYAATVGGVTLSIPRQVAKTFLVGRIVFILCVLFPGLRVIWTAHRTRTASNTFKHLQGYAKRPKVAAHVADIRRTNGEQEILFTNGSIIMFGAREAGFGRGFDEIDIEVFDEAQILTAKALEDMVAATNQTRHPHGALLFFMGTPPRPVDPGEAFTLRRQDALSHKTDDTPFGEPVEGEDQLYIECSADADADPDDRKQWAKANPSVPERTPWQSMLRLRKNLPSDESWLREGLGVWDDDSADGPVSADAWMALEGKSPERPDPVCFAVTVAPDRSWSTITVAGHRPDGLTQLAIAKTQRGTLWVVDEVVRMSASRSPVSVAVPADDAAASLIPALNEAKVPVRTLNRSEYARACGLFVDAVDPKPDDEGNKHPTIRHDGGHLVPVSLRAARWQKVGIGDLRAFAPPKDGSVDIAPLKAMACALYALADVKAPSKRPGNFRGIRR